MARVELGEYRSQGLDYAYTLQGWIKGVNKTYGVVPAAEDFNVGKDAFAYSLGYFENDYSAINSTEMTDERDHLWTRLDETIGHNGLYNGNISWMVTDLAKIGEVNNDRKKGMQAMLYKYDQLHRITQSRGLTGYSASTGFAFGTGAYDETYSYDGNGNILTLDRMNGQGQLLHNYDYYYYKETNKLRGVLPITRDTLYNGAINSNAKLYRDIIVAGTARPQSGTPSALRATRDITLQNNFEAEEGMDFAAYIPEDGPFVYDAIGNLVADEEEGSKISWTPYGKVRDVKTKNDSVVVRFKYDATGNRIEKRVEQFDTTRITRYVRDASGNVMAIYNDTTVTERPVYGSSRLGMYRGEVLEGDQMLGRRDYELGNHLGNVLSVITDNIGMTEGDSTWAYVTSTNDYYPFGLDMKERSWRDTASLAWRYGFNGKEKDDEGEWGSIAYDYGFRVYDPRIAKFLSVDPLTKSYPELTPYQFASNTPIQAIDLDGLEAVTVSGGGRVTALIVTVAINVTLAVGPNGISLFVAPEAGLGAGVSIGAGVSVGFFPNVSHTEQLGGWGINVGVSIMGNGGDISASIQQDDKTGEPNDLKFGGAGGVPRIGGGAGAEGHLSASYSFLIGTVSWDNLAENISEWAEQAGMPVDQFQGMVDQAKTTYEAYMKDQVKLNDTNGNNSPSKIKDKKDELPKSKSEPLKVTAKVKSKSENKDDSKLPSNSTQN